MSEFIDPVETLRHFRIAVHEHEYLQDLTAKQRDKVLEHAIRLRDKMLADAEEVTQLQFGGELGYEATLESLLSEKYRLKAEEGGCSYSEVSSFIVCAESLISHDNGDEIQGVHGDANTVDMGVARSINKMSMSEAARAFYYAGYLDAKKLRRGYTKHLIDSLQKVCKISDANGHAPDPKIFAAMIRNVKSDENKRGQKNDSHVRFVKKHVKKNM